jgi:hypothetical protein
MMARASRLAMLSALAIAAFAGTAEAQVAAAGAGGAEQDPVIARESTFGELGLRRNVTPGAAAPPRARASTTRQPVRAEVQRIDRSRVRPVVVQPVATLPAPVEPVPARRRRIAEEDPYAAIGWRLGSLRLFTATEDSVGYDTNPNRRTGAAAKGSSVLRTEGELRLQSDFSRHALDGFLRGSFARYPEQSEADRPAADGRLTWRHDFTRDLTGEVEGRLRIDTQRPGSPELNVSVRERPIVATTGLTAGLTQRFNRLSIGLRGLIDRDDYADAKLSNGAVLDQGDRNTTTYGLRLRGGYEVTPGVTPFVEARVDTRVPDREIDQAGFRRQSTGVSARAGTTFEITRLLTGEVAAGYEQRDYEDGRLRDLRGPILDAALVWSATPLTQVRVSYGTTLEESTIPGASGAITHNARLEVQHDLRRHFSVTGTLGASRTQYRGISLEEEGLSAGARLEYKFNRSVAVRASFTHERLKSSTPGSDYTANVYLLGLRLQR